MANNGPAEVFGVFTTDRDLKIKVWDNGMIRFTGLAAEDARGKEVQLLFPEIKSRGLLQTLEKVLADSVVRVLAPAFHRYLIPCSTQKPSQRFDRMLQRVTIAPVEEDGEVVGLIITIEDVTERIERERELDELLASTDEQVRLEAIKEITRSEEINNRMPLVTTLKDENWQVRKAAIEGLSKRAAPDAIQALLEMLRQDHRNLAVLNSALQVLAMVDVDTYSPLVEFLQSDDSDLRMQAALALGEQREERAVGPLIQALKDEDMNVRFHAIEALGKIGSPAATEALANVAESTDFFLSFPALDALKEIGDSSVAPRITSLLKVEMLSEPAAEALGALGDEKAVTPLASLLNAPNPPTLSIARALTMLYDRFEQEFGEGSYIAEIAGRAIKASGAQHLLDALGEVRVNDLRPLAVVIGWLNGPAVHRALIRLLAEPSVRSEVVESLVRNGKGVAELLLEQTNSEDVEIRRASVIALGRLGHKKATSVIVRLLLEDSELRIDAAQSLAKLGDESALEGLIEMMGDPDAAVRQAVVGALNSIGSSQMSSRVQSLLNDPNPLVRESAAKIAGYFGYPASADLLLKSCKDEDERVRQAAVEHLPFLEDDRVEAVLIDAVRHDTRRVRAAAARALAQQQNQESMNALLDALNDDDLWVRYFAARSLGNYQLPIVVEALSVVVNRETHNNVRIAALEALGRLGGDVASSTIESYIDAPDQDVARAAVESLLKARNKENLGKQDRDD